MSEQNKTTGHQSMQVTSVETELQSFGKTGNIDFGNNLKMGGLPDPGCEVIDCTINFSHHPKNASPQYDAQTKRITVELPHHLYLEYMTVAHSGRQLKMTYEEVDGVPNARLFAVL